MNVRTFDRLAMLAIFLLVLVIGYVVSRSEDRKAYRQACREAFYLLKDCPDANHQ